MKRLAAILLSLLMLCSFALAESEPSVLEIFDFTAALASGETFTLSDHLGEVVFVNFWATWCGPCVYELPAINDLYAKYQDAEDVTVVSVNCGDRASIVSAFLADKGYALPAVCDEDNAICMHYGVSSIPFTVIFDKTGAVGGAWVGVVADVSEICDHYSNAIEALR